MNQYFINRQLKDNSDVYDFICTSDEINVKDKVLLYQYAEYNYHINHIKSNLLSEIDIRCYNILKNKFTKHQKYTMSKSYKKERISLPNDEIYYYYYFKLINNNTYGITYALDLVNINNEPVNINKEKKKPIKKEKVINLLIILDKSGSMGPTWNKTKSSMIDFINKQQEEKDLNATLNLSLVLFSSYGKNDERIFNNSILNEKYRYTEVLLNTNINDIISNKLNIPDPDGMTALYRSLINAINTQDEINKKENPNGTLVVLFTDGEENNSGSPYNSGLVKELILNKEKEGWIFSAFVASDSLIRNVEVLGFNKEQIIVFGKEVIHGSLNVLNRMSTQIRTEVETYSLSFTDDDRTMSRYGMNN